MICTKQTMWKVGVGVLLAAAIAFAALPEFRAWILALSPVLLFLLCPLSMIFCMKMMNDKQCQTPGSDQQDKTSAAPANMDGKRS